MNLVKTTARPADGTGVGGSGRRPGGDPGPGLRALVDRYDPLALQNMLLGVLAPVVLLLLLNEPAVFRQDRTWWVMGCAASFVVFGVVSAALRRIGSRMVLVRCFEALLMIPLLGSCSTELGVVVCCAITGPMVLVSAATALDGARLLVLAGVLQVSLTVLLLGQSVDPFVAAVCGFGGTVLSGIPALVVLRYRRSLGAAVSAAEMLSRTDPLTGLLNRAGMDSELPEVFARAARGGDAIGVLLVDVDHFKRVNDTYGHAAGDEVLRRVAEAVRSAVRDDDIVTRLGGEEMCVVGRYRSAADLALAGERVRLAVAEMPGPPGVTVSVGGALAPVPPGADRAVLPSVLPSVLASVLPSVLASVLPSLLHRADELMYEVKQAGRNGVRVVGVPAPPGVTSGAAPVPHAPAGR